MMYSKIISCKTVINVLKTEHKLKNTKYKKFLNVCVYVGGDDDGFNTFIVKGTRSYCLVQMVFL